MLGDFIGGKGRRVVDHTIIVVTYADTIKKDKKGSIEEKKNNIRLQIKEQFEIKDVMFCGFGY